MIDISEMQVEVRKLHQRNEELLAYMSPTAAQRDEVRRNCVKIAKLSLQMYDLYTELK